LDEPLGELVEFLQVRKIGRRDLDLDKSSKRACNTDHVGEWWTGQSVMRVDRTACVTKVG
jgi:hypothetical protein